MRADIMRAPRRSAVSLVRASVRLRIKELNRPSAMAPLAGIPACVGAFVRCAAVFACVIARVIARVIACVFCCVTHLISASDPALSASLWSNFL